MVSLSPSFWQNRKVLVTGHTGFKGSWLSLYLHKMQANVLGLALEPSTNPNMFSACGLDKKIKSQIIDIRNLAALEKAVNDFQPEVVFHLAAQALVGESYTRPVDTYATNVMGTIHLLESCRKTSSVKVIVNVTSDKCYENKESQSAYQETDALGGYDPYSNSKACAELVSAAYRQSFFQSKLGLATARAGNIIGGGDWAPTRLVPDFVRSVKDKKPLILRNPKAIRPWQHVLEPVYGYMMLAERLWMKPKEFNGPWNFGPEESSCVAVENVVNKLIQYWGQGSFSHEISDIHETQTLKLDSVKAKNVLAWKPRWSLNKALEMSANWYHSFYNNEDMHSITLKQIETYEKSI